MGKLHELLAVEKTRTAAFAALSAETAAKLAKIDFFQGHVKTLKMLEDSEANKVLEAQSSESRILPTTVKETLTYLMGFWAQAEDVQFQKNVTNRNAVADLMFRGEVLASEVPVDELMGLTSRLEALRNLFKTIPTLPAAIVVSNADSQTGRQGSWIGTAESTVKTEKAMVPVVLYEATEKHPAQVKEVTKDIVVGKFEMTKFYGMATSQQKADVLTILDDLIAETKMARQRANSVEASTDVIGNKIASVILAAFQ
jgi:hypothetical protein